MLNFFFAFIYTNMMARLQKKYNCFTPALYPWHECFHHQKNILCLFIAHVFVQKNLLVWWQNIVASSFVNIKMILYWLKKYEGYFASRDLKLCSHRSLWKEVKPFFPQRWNGKPEWLFGVKTWKKAGNKKFRSFRSCATSAWVLIFFHDSFFLL